MKFSIPQKELSIALTRCAAIAASSRTSLPVLANVLLTPLDSMLKICATDLEVGFTTIVDGIFWNEACNGNESPFLLPAKTLCDCIKAMPDGDVTFDVIDHIATISSGTARFVLTGLDSADFPQIETSPGDGITFDPTALGHVLKHVAYCQSRDADKFNLNGVFLQLEHNVEGDLFFVTAATDGHRLCTDTNQACSSDQDDLIEGEIPDELVKGIVIPTKGVAELIKLVGDGPAVMSLVKNTLVVSLGDEILTLHLIESTFPDVKRVIPKDPPHQIKVKRQSLIDALERCRIITHKDSRRVNLSASENSINIESAIPAVGQEAADHISAEYGDTPPAISLNVEYLLQALGNMSTAEVELYITDELTPMIINPVGTDFPQAIVMPMRA